MLPCRFDWHHLYHEQFPSYAGNPAVVVEVQHSQHDSALYAAALVNALDLKGSIKYWTCMDEEAETFAAQFKDGGLAFVFIDGVHTYERTMACLKAFYPKTHYNSAIAGHGSHEPEVMRAVRDFFAEKDLPIRISGSCWICNHAHKPKELW